MSMIAPGRFANAVGLVRRVSAMRKNIRVRLEFLCGLFDCIALVGGFNATKPLDSRTSADNIPRYVI
jgi:hypothetical protein